MNFQTWAKEAAKQQFSDEDLATIRQYTTKMLETERDHPFPNLVMKMLDQINLNKVNNTMVDVLALQEKLTDRETRLRAMEKAYFEKVVEVDRLKEKLGVRI